MREPTPDDQLRVAVVGDSLAQGIGFFAERVFKPFWAEVFKQGRISTGLARLDYFNWLAQMQTIVDRADPDLVARDDRRERQPGAAQPGRHARAGYRDLRLGRALRGARRAVREDRDQRGRARRLDRAAERARQEPLGLHPDNRTRSPRRWPIGSRTSTTSTRGTRSPRPTADTARSTATARRSARSARHDGVHFNTDGYTLLIEKAAQFATQRLQPRPEDLRLLNAAPEPSGDRRHVGQVLERRSPRPPGRTRSRAAGRCR